MSGEDNLVAFPEGGASPTGSSTRSVGEGGAGHPSPAPATAQPSPGLTLAAYAKAKQLPAEYLHSLGLSDVHYLGRPALRIPYLDSDGREHAVRFRLELAKGDQVDNRFRWKSGAKPCLYGLVSIALAEERGYVVMVEGESDTQTLLYHEIPALGVPGAANWREEWAEQLSGIPVIYIVVEPDQGGQAMLRWLGSSALRERARLITMTPEAKDPSALYLAAPDGFAARFAELMEAAVPWADATQAEREALAASNWTLCRTLAHEPDILACFAASLRERGVAGEARAAKLIYLALTSRLLDRPSSLAVKGPSGGGKSYLVEATCAYFPSSAIYALSGMSERALAYSTEPLCHRFLALYEAVGMHNDFVSYLIRSLLSEGRIRYETVIKTKDGMEPLLIEREGPTGLLVTTTAVSLHPENETRMLSVPVTDSREQTAAVLAAIAADDRRPANDGLAPWQALQGWLEGDERRVSVPYAAALAGMVPPLAVRLRRDFATLLNLVRAHALLHRATRQWDERGRILATLADYGPCASWWPISSPRASRRPSPPPCARRSLRSPGCTAHWASRSPTSSSARP
jgi:hypothetical protein